MNWNDSIEQGSLRIRNVDVPIVTRFLDVTSLNFFVDNPRIYSLVHVNQKTPDQNDIYSQLIDMDHVKELIQDIKLNDGLIDPIIVRNGIWDVLEGNSRLAAYKYLCIIDPVKWGRIKSTILPQDIDEKLIYALLGQYHVKGKKDWSPYEQAGFLYRRFKIQNEDLPTVSTELGITQKHAKHLINVYEFMAQHGVSETTKWSYYDEYMKNRNIQKARSSYANFDSLIVTKIRTGEIKRAVDVRDELPAICSAPKVLKKFAERRIDFSNAFEEAEDFGADSPALKRLRKFRDWLGSAEAEASLMDSSDEAMKKINFELQKIKQRSTSLLVKFEKK